jgi:hypothetical protein
METKSVKTVKNEKQIRVNLLNGKSVKTPIMSFCIEVWYDGKWQALSVFKQDKHDDAEKEVKAQKKNFRNVRLIQMY